MDIYQKVKGGLFFVNIYNIQKLSHVIFPYFIVFFVIFIEISNIVICIVQNILSLARFHFAISQICVFKP